MKIQDLLREDSNTIVERLVVEITAKCQPFLKEIHYQPSDHQLYRGMHTGPLPTLTATGEIRTVSGHNPKRKPKDTSQYIHDEANHIFTHQFKFPFRNGLFTTGDPDAASGYGDIFVVIPIGEFHYLWSAYVDDMFDGWQNWLHDALQNLKQLNTAATQRKIEDSYLDAIEANKFQYQTNNLLTGIQSNHEIMLYCDQCFVLPYRDPNVVQALKVIQRNHGAK